MQFDELQEGVREIRFTWGGMDGSLTYRLGVVDEAFWEWYRTHGNERDTLIDAVARLVTSWEVDGQDGKPLPVTREVMEGKHPQGPKPFPTRFLEGVYHAVLTDRPFVTQTTEP